MLVLIQRQHMLQWTKFIFCSNNTADEQNKAVDGVTGENVKDLEIKAGDEE